MDVTMRSDQAQSDSSQVPTCPKFGIQFDEVVNGKDHTAFARTATMSKGRHMYL